MARGDDINIGIAGDASKFIRETGDVEDALKDVADALDDMARDTKRGGEDAERAVSDLEDSFDDARKKARDLGDAGDKAGADVEKGMKRAEGGVKDMGREAESTATEAAASFDGSAESIGDAFQEVAANAFAGFGPAGAVAGIAAAAGIGLAVAGFEQTAEAQAESEEAIAGWADKFIEAGNRIITNSQVMAEVVAIATDPERYKEAAENAKNWGVDEGTAMRAMAGDAAALAVTQETVNARRERFTEILEENATGSGNSYDKMQKLTEAEQALVDQHSAGIASWEKLTGEMAAGEERARTVSDAFLGMIDDASGAAIQVDELGNKVVTLPDNTQIFIDAKTGQASQNVSGFKGKLDEIPKTKAIVVNGTVSLDKSAITNYRPTVRVNVEGYDRFGRRAI